MFFSGVPLRSSFPGLLMSTLIIPWLAPPSASMSSMQSSSAPN